MHIIKNTEILSYYPKAVPLYYMYRPTTSLPSYLTRETTSTVVRG